MAEPASIPVDQGAGTYVCATCTNRMYTFMTLPLPPCTVCGGAEWRVVGAGGAPSTNGS